MKLTFNILIVTGIFFTNYACKKKVVPPSNEAKGKQIIYIDVEGKKYLFQQNYKFYTAQTQRGEYTDLHEATLFKFYTDTTLPGYDIYKLNIDINSRKDGLFFGGFALQFWYKDPNSPIYIKRIDTDRSLPNPSKNWKNSGVKIIKFDYFKINELKEVRKRKYINFETSYQFSDSLFAPKIYHAYWKADISINANF